jgi:hypothetical protein
MDAAWRYGQIALCVVSLWSATVAWIAPDERLTLQHSSVLMFGECCRHFRDVYDRRPCSSIARDTEDTEAVFIEWLLIGNGNTTDTGGVPAVRGQEGRTPSTPRASQH